MVHEEEEENYRREQSQTMEMKAIKVKGSIFLQAVLDTQKSKASDVSLAQKCKSNDDCGKKK